MVLVCACGKCRNYSVFTLSVRSAVFSSVCVRTVLKDCIYSCRVVYILIVKLVDELGFSISVKFCFKKIFHSFSVI